MNDCLFCKIVNNDVESDILYEDRYVIVIKDKYPSYEQHNLIITKTHFDNLNEIIKKDVSTLNSIIVNVPNIVKAIGMQDYSLKTNNGILAGQMIEHLHIHLTCGKRIK